MRRTPWVLALALSLMPSLLPHPASAEERKSPHHKKPASHSGVAIPPAAALADVAEVEPNDTPGLAQALGCGDALRPATLANSAVRDTDWISFTAAAGQLIVHAGARGAEQRPL